MFPIAPPHRGCVFHRDACPQTALRSPARLAGASLGTRARLSDRACARWIAGPTCLEITMNKERFLREEHARIVACGEFVSSEWRDSVDRFISDLWDMTNFQKAGRYLAPRDKSLGFSRDNVEYHFERVGRRVTAAKPTRKITKKMTTKAKSKPQAPTANERRAVEAAARLERRRRLAEQVLAWDLRAKRG